MDSVFILRAAHHRGTCTVKQIIQRFMLISIFGVIMCGCSYGIFNTEPFVDSHRDDKGNVILEDTSQNWHDYVTYSVEPRIADEIAGKVPDAGLKTWNDYWLWRIEIFPINHENRKRYIDYIIDRRRQDGLPELVSQAEQK